MKKSTGIFIGCGGLLIVGIIVGAVLGFIGYRNMNPSPSAEDVPEIAGRFKKDKLKYASGSLFGNTEAFTAHYSSTESGKKATLTYLLSNLADKLAAVQMMDRLPCDFEVKKGIVKDKSGREIGIFRVCGISNPTFQMTNDNRSLVVTPNTDASPVTLSDIENFVTSLSFNSNVDFADLNIGFADSGTIYDTKKTALTSAAPSGEVLNAYELVKQHEKSRESVSKYNDKEITIRGYIKFPLTISNPSDGGLAPLGEKTATIEGQLKTIKCWFKPEEVGAFSVLKGEQYITVKGIFNGKYLAELRYCKLVKVEQIINLKPDSMTGYYNRGIAFLNKGDWELSIKDFTKVLDIDQKDIKSYKLRAKAYRNSAKSPKPKPMKKRDNVVKKKMKEKKR